MIDKNREQFASEEGGRATELPGEGLSRAAWPRLFMGMQQGYQLPSTDQRMLGQVCRGIAASVQKHVQSLQLLRSSPDSKLMACGW